MGHKVTGERKTAAETCQHNSSKPQSNLSFQDTRRLLRKAVSQNYCAYDALHTDPLLVKLRRSPEFSGLLSAAKECQSRFLAQRDPH